MKYESTRATLLEIVKDKERLLVDARSRRDVALAEADALKQQAKTLRRVAEHQTSSELAVYQDARNAVRCFCAAVGIPNELGPDMGAEDLSRSWGNQLVGTPEGFAAAAAKHEAYARSDVV